jgi:hypothetical protein
MVGGLVWPSWMSSLDVVVDGDGEIKCGDHGLIQTLKAAGCVHLSDCISTC